MALWRQVGDGAGIAQALSALAWVALHGGDYRRAQVARRNTAALWRAERHRGAGLRPGVLAPAYRSPPGCLLTHTPIVVPWRSWSVARAWRWLPRACSAPAHRSRCARGVPRYVPCRPADHCRAVGPGRCRSGCAALHQARQPLSGASTLGGGRDAYSPARPPASLRCSQRGRAGQPHRCAPPKPAVLPGHSPRSGAHGPPTAPDHHRAGRSSGSPTARRWACPGSGDSPPHIGVPGPRGWRCRNPAWPG